MMQLRETLKTPGGLVDSGRAILARLLGHGARASHLRTPPARPAYPALFRVSGSIPLPMTEQEIAQLAATLPRLGRVDPSVEADTRAPQPQMMCTASAPAIAAPAARIDAEIDQALSTALARLRALTIQGRH